MNWTRIFIIGILVIIGLSVFNSWDKRRIAKGVHEERYGRQVLDAIVQGALEDARRIETMNEQKLMQECARVRCWEE